MRAVLLSVPEQLTKLDEAQNKLEAALLIKPSDASAQSLLIMVTNKINTFLEDTLIDWV
ncbi:MAG: hypothetical protein KFB95_02615 [Simkaniaceae bacterium]|nr:MAG: hypothetical protein KFB95_02615 [Simkaniaceae bacterium]